MVRYKAIVSNTRMYQEVELPAEGRPMRFGTTKMCNVRFSRNRFFSDFEITFEYDGENWGLFCCENSYISTDGVMILTSKALAHGDDLTLKYRDSNQEIMHISFVIDFEYDTKDYERVIDITGRETLTIGGARGSDIVLEDPLIGNDTVMLVNEGGTYLLQDNGTKYGAYVNGIKVAGQQTIRDFDFFSIIGYSFYYKYGLLYTSKSSRMFTGELPVQISAESDGGFEYPRFNRSTRIKYQVPDEEIPVLDPPAPPTKPTQNIALSLMPALVMIALTILIRGQMGSGGAFVIFSVCSMGMGVVTSVASIVSQKKKYKTETAQRIEKYTNYIQQKKQLLIEKRREERNILEEIYYAPPRELAMIQNFSSDLFNRRPDDEDFLYLRLGTGSLLSHQPVGFKEQEKFETEDELAELPVNLAQEFRYLPKVPIVVDCASNGGVGIVGTRPQLYGMLKNTLLDMSTRHYYNDLRVMLFVTEEQAPKLAWIRLLPHIYNDQIDMRNIACDDESKNILFEYLYKELSHRESAKISSPRVVVLVYEDVGIKSHPISNYIDNAEALGVTFIFFAEGRELLPLGCKQIIVLRDNENSGQLVDSEDSTQTKDFSYETIDDIQASAFVQKLAPVYCEEISLESSLTKNISLYELLEIFSVADIDLAQRWGASEVYKSMAAPLGVKSKSEVVALDLHEKYHGPHGLVAGTTGSGKSEILQSYILSMATLFHPYEVGFVIIDFKGGGMVNQFKDLPHLIGAITNIDGREIDRSLLSIKAELKKRQALFAQHDVNHIDAYIKLFKKGEAKTPLPHLILIVDEFAELKMDQPEFMKELVSAARIGRSLGVHLILATQKPSGVVDAQIWSNSKFKLCLKVQTKEDSNEVIKTPLAAEIKEPGRAYLQVGNNEIFELFQSAYSGAAATTDLEQKKKYAVYSVSLAGKRTKVFEQKPDKSGNKTETQLDAIVDYVADYCENNNIERLPGICLPPLRDMIPYLEAEKPGENASFIVPLGIYDDPNHQLQTQVNLDLLAGNTFILGASQYGKTALLQLLVRGIAENYTPEEVSVYIMDFASMALKIFDGLCHVGGVITADEDIKLKTLFRIIGREIAQRKDKFSKLGITSFTSYREAGYTDLPCMVLVLDNIAAFRELYDGYDDTLLGFCREGLAVGISIVATTTQIRGIGYRYLSNFSNNIALYCNQKEEYNSLFERCRIQPKNVPGRALISLDKELFEYQNYLAFEGEKEIDRVNDIRAFIQTANEQHKGMEARRIPEIPDLLTPDFIQQNFPQPAPYCISAGMDYNSVDSVWFNLAKMGYAAVSGREKSGRTNFVRYLFWCLEQNIKTQPVEACVFDGYERQLEVLQQHKFVTKYSTELEELEAAVTAIEQECETRRQHLKAQGMKALESMPLLVVVIQNGQYFEANGLSKPCAESVKKILKTAKELKVFFLYASVENAPIAYGGPDVLKYIKEAKNLLFFDDLQSLKLLDVQLGDLRANKKPVDVGDAFFIDDRNLIRLKTPYLEQLPEG